MKVLFITYGLSIAGGNRAIFEVANRLSDRGYYVEVLALGGDHSWFDVKVSVKYLELPKRMRTLLRAYSLIKYLRVKEYKYIDVNTFAKRLGFRVDLIRPLAEAIPNNFDAAVATYYPTALSLWLSRHEGLRLYFVQDFPELASADGHYGLRLWDLTLRIPFNAFLAVSTYIKNLILERQYNAKILVTGAGVDINVFKPSKDKLVDVKGKYKVMTIIGSNPWKGADVAIRVLSEVSRKLPIHAILVGDREFVDLLIKSVKHSFTYTVFSNVPDDLLARLYSSADAFLFTSYVEGFGLPPLEAMASGTPVVTTDCLGNRDYVIDGVNALVAKPGDVEGLANSLIKILMDEKLRERLIENGLKTAKQWSWDKVVDKFEEAIKGESQ
ncbi:glycosyltransferase family 4 protein [Caldivirga maquilingensis]|uniref:Glycosyl transferase group 1 n=1 Tax=Caldivirga maquilingensis (strain ATCC 700844 / DSM 13496 / JCM 10307 / IC-167) TaxID=397948 RepID=A8M976_CALMQ|nr:glycosyltransferase family 4 protein [Caldivirga maquilingensis]ABW02295.1 glycosyl transferase group 1 [Caldivirga maquilingensis IC-167]